MIWLKSFGWKDVAKYDGLLFNQPHYRIDFSTNPGRPSVQIHDTLILYGIGVSKIMYVATAIGEPFHATEVEIAEESWRAKWPWCVESENLSQAYGLVWNQHNLNPYELVGVFHQANPNAPVTRNGNKGLGAFLFSKDRVKLTDAFGQFLVDQVMNLNH